MILCGTQNGSSMALLNLLNTFIFNSVGISLRPVFKINSVHNGKPFKKMSVGVCLLKLTLI